jgi:hypothetical protein
LLERQAILPPETCERDGEECSAHGSISGDSAGNTSQFSSCDQTLGIAVSPLLSAWRVP